MPARHDSAAKARNEADRLKAEFLAGDGATWQQVVDAQAEAERLESLATPPSTLGEAIADRYAPTTEERP